MKRCIWCDETKPPDAFHRNKNEPDGRTPQCGECRNARRRETGERRPCAQCGREFAARSGGRYCSRVCHGASKVTAVTVACAVCGAGFTVKAADAGRRKTCSRACAGTLRRGGRPLTNGDGTATCRACGETKRLRAFPRRTDGQIRGECTGCRATRQRDGHARRRAERGRVYPPPAKTCGACGETKPAGDFPFRKGALDGLGWRCRPCQSAYYRTWRRRDPVARRAYGAAWRSACRRKGAPGTFSPADVLRLWHRQRGECARCGVRFGKRPEDGGYHVDHVTPVSRGGSNWPRNLQLLCPTDNLRKNAKTPAEYTLYLRRLEGAT